MGSIDTAVLDYLLTPEEGAKKECVVGKCLHNSHEHIKRCYWKGEATNAYLDLCWFHQGVFKTYGWMA